MEVNTNTNDLEDSTKYSMYGATGARQSSVVTSIGHIRTLPDVFKKRVDLIFLVLSFINLATAFALSLYELLNFVKNGQTDTPDFTLAIILIINIVFCVLYVCYGLLREKKWELYVLILAIVVVLLYCNVEYFINITGRSNLKLARLILVWLLGVPHIIFAAIVTRHFRYLVFQSVGAIADLQDVYEDASIFSSFLRFDIQVTASFVVLGLKDGTDLNTPEVISLSVGLPFSVCWNIFAYIILRKEWKKAARIFVFIDLVKPCFYGYQIWKEATRIKDAQTSDDRAIIIITMVAGVLGIVIWMLVMKQLRTVYKNFDKGFREKVYEKTSSENTSLITGRRKGQGGSL